MEKDLCESLPQFSFIAEIKSLWSPSSFVLPGSADAGLWVLKSVWTAKHVCVHKCCRESFPSRDPIMGLGSMSVFQH